MRTIHRAGFVSSRVAGLAFRICPMSRRHYFSVVRLMTVFLLALGFVSAAAWADLPPSHGLDEVNHKQVELGGGFWGPRLKTGHEVTVPHALDCLE